MLCRPQSLTCVSFLLFVLASGPECRSDNDDFAELASARGLCVQIGFDERTFKPLAASQHRLLHCLDQDRGAIARLHQRQATDPDVRASIVGEHWVHPTLPHADNLANVVVVHGNLVPAEEVYRILRPGGVALFCTGTDVTRYVKPNPADTDEWSHQWHATDGGLTSEDRRVGVPTGVQWIAGPLFAMAGRKSSTQTLVTSGGINFYVTQNVSENVGRAADQMQQYLVALDSYNGILLWKRPWTGPFVSGNGETNPRMIAAPHALYAVTDPGSVVVIDPLNGQTTDRFPLDESHQIDKIMLHANRLFVQSRTRLTAFDAERKTKLWHLDRREQSSLTANDDRLFLLSAGRSSDGRFRHELICVNAADGSIVYRQNTQPHVTAARVRINFVADDYVALQAHGSLHLFAAADGSHLWTKTTDARPGKTYVDERYVGHFYRRGLVWMLSQNSPRESFGQNVWLALNPATGETVRELTTQGEWPRTDTPAKMGCQVLIASDRYIMIPRQATFIDFDTGEKRAFKFTRGGCGLGFVPANGLLYSHPHACGCFTEALRGFMGMHSLDAPTATPPPTAALTSFQPAAQDKTAEGAVPWPVYRGNAERSGYSPARLGKRLRRKWSVRIRTSDSSVSRDGWSLRTGNTLTAATVAAGKVFVADADAGRLVALDVATGEPLWQFHAAGRIDSPPTFYEGLCVFGAHDGCVYCLQAATGEPCWKRRLAPTDRRIVAYGGLESAWPVSGTTLVRNGLILAAAGRAPDADGGLFAEAIDPGTGQPVWQQQLSGGALRGLCDYFIADQNSVYLANWKFDPATGFGAPAADSTHLQGGKAGLLESSWRKHDLAIRKNIQTWTAQGMAGQLLVWSPHAQAAFDAETGALTIRHATVDEPRQLQLSPQEQITAMAITPEVLIIAGGTDRTDAGQPGFLRLIDLRTGHIRHSERLPAEAGFDSLAVADGRLFVCAQNGTILSFETR
ncbi:MAG: PQQ-binding-like beta-propeller repeat protein [Planctomycetaceae bacterium]|nr:PQQ-binding-like beta-propeller repeat protein [Planctomycetaceae bacterium]